MDTILNGIGMSMYVSFKCVRSWFHLASIQIEFYAKYTKSYMKNAEHVWKPFRIEYILT